MTSSLLKFSNEYAPPKGVGKGRTGAILHFINCDKTGTSERLWDRVRNCAFLVANATENFGLATRISQLVASGRLTISCHAQIIQTITLIFSQIDKNKIQSRPPIGDLLFTFPLLLKYKTDFPVIINLSQRFTARAVRSFAAMFFERKMLHGCGLVRTTWRSVENAVGKIVYGFEHRAENQPAVFQSGTFLLQKVETREGIKLT